MMMRAVSQERGGRSGTTRAARPMRSSSLACLVKDFGSVHVECSIYDRRHLLFPVVVLEDACHNPWHDSFQTWQLPFLRHQALPKKERTSSGQKNGAKWIPLGALLNVKSVPIHSRIQCSRCRVLFPNSKRCSCNLFLRTLTGYSSMPGCAASRVGAARTFVESVFSSRCVATRPPSNFSLSSAATSLVWSCLK